MIDWSNPTEAHEQLKAMPLQVRTKELVTEARRSIDKLLTGMQIPTVVFNHYALMRELRALAIELEKTE